MYYNSLCQLLAALLFSWYVGGMPVLCVLVFALASHICTLDYLLGPLPSKASFLDLLFLFLEVLLLCFLSLLDLFRAFGLLPPIVLTKLQLRLSLPALVSAFLTPMCLSSVGLANIVLQ